MNFLEKITTSQKLFLIETYDVKRNPHYPKLMVRIDLHQLTPDFS